MKRKLDLDLDLDLDPDPCISDATDMLRDACRNGDIALVTHLVIDMHVDINKADDVGWTPLVLACFFDHEDVAKFLIMHGVDVNKTHPNISSALSYACHNVRKELIKLLVDRGADVNKMDWCGWTPFLGACSSANSEDIVKFLIEHGADVNKPSYDGRTPLIVACYHYYGTGIAKILIEHGADVNKAANDGQTPLHEACFSDCRDTVEFLVKHGADVNKADNDGWTPVYMACFRGHSDIAEILIKHGADVDKPVNNGKTPFHAACFCGFKDAISTNASVNAIAIANAINQTIGNSQASLNPTHFECHHYTAELLIACGANVPSSLEASLYEAFGGKGQFARYFIEEYVLPTWRMLCHGTMSLDSPLSMLRGFGHVVNHICLLNTPNMLRKQCPEKELH